MSKIKQHWVILLIILIGVFLRFNNFSSLYHFTMDEEVMDMIQRRIVLLEHFPLIGSVSPLSTYLGPYFYYLGAFILFLSSLNPLGQGIFGAFLGLVNIFLIYIVGKNFFNKKVGQIAALLYSTSFLMTIFDRRYWHLTPGPFLSLIVLWSLYKMKNGSIKYAYLLVVALILGWNTDYTNLILFLFTFLVWFIFKLPVRRKEVLFAVLIFIISNTPLVYFDFRHNFLNTKSFVTYFEHKSAAKKKEQIKIDKRETLGLTKGEQTRQTLMLPILTFSRTIYTFSDLNITEQHTYCKPVIFERNEKQGILLPIAAALVILIFAYLVFINRKSKTSFNYKIILSFYLIFQLGVVFYAYVFKGDVFEHYLVTLMPYLFLMLAVVLYQFSAKKYLYLGVIMLFIICTLNIKNTLLSYNSLSFENKVMAAKYALNTIDGHQFSLESLGRCYSYDGFYYPFLMNGKTPVKSFQDANYSWLYNYTPVSKDPDRIVVMVPKSRFEDQKFYSTYQRYQQWVIKRARFGDLEVLILDNSKGDFH